MEIQQVRYFVALCETLNFTRAAERSNVSQPSLTRAIKLLEHELGGALFVRGRLHATGYAAVTLIVLALGAILLTRRLSEASGVSDR